MSIRVRQAGPQPAAPVVHTTAASHRHDAHTTGCTLNWRAGMLYMMLKALAITAGMRVHPTASPIKPAQEAGPESVADVLFGDGPPGEAQSLERADLGALVLHHAGHGGQAGQGRHQEEDHREHIGQVALPARRPGRSPPRRNWCSGPEQYHSHSSISSTWAWASASSVSASAISASASAFPSSYSCRPSAYSASPSCSSAKASASS